MRLDSKVKSACYISLLDQAVSNLYIDFGNVRTETGRLLLAAALDQESATLKKEESAFLEKYGNTYQETMKKWDNRNNTAKATEDIKKE